MTLVAEKSTEQRPKTHLIPKPSSSSHTRTNNNTHNNIHASSSGLTNKMNKFTSMAFNRLGCGSWWPESEATKVRTRKKKRSSVKKTSNNVVSDVFCAPPGIGFSSDAAFVDCVEPVAVARRKHRKHARLVRFPVSDGFNTRPYWLHSEEMMSHSQGREGILVLDQFGELRLDVDNMSYEELVDLSERIGYVSTGLREDEVIRCLMRLPDLDGECKCSICQEEYEAKDEMGRLKCGHCYHICCIKPWLLHNSSCPICKAKAKPVPH